MQIATDAGWLPFSGSAIAQQFIDEALHHIASLHPEHTFIFLLPPDAEKNFPANIIPLYNKIPSNFLKKYIAAKWKLPQILKKHQATIFLSQHYLSLPKNISCCIVIQQPLIFSKIKKAGLEKAAAIIVPTAFAKQFLVEKYHLLPDKINIVHPVADEIFRPLSWENREDIKQQFADGKEYFLSPLSNSFEENLLAVKAFSFLKRKWQSGMKLIMYSDNNMQPSRLLKSLTTYRYKSDVQVLQAITVKDRALLTGAAYALLYPSASNNFSLPVLEALQCEVPVIAAGSEVVQEIGGDAALYFKPNDVENFGEQLSLLYKDETLRKKLISRAKKNAAPFTKQQSAADLWKCIISAACNS